MNEFLYDVELVYRYKIRVKADTLGEAYRIMRNSDVPQKTEYWRLLAFRPHLIETVIDGEITKYEEVNP